MVSLRVLLVFCILGVYGCSTAPLLPDDPQYAPVVPKILNPPAVTNGSLFKVGHAVDLWQDQRARRVGDILTVTLSESTTSTKSSSSSLSKDYSTASENPTLLGTLPSLSGGMNLGNSVAASRDFEGEAGADQRNSLSGNITVTVADVMPNGILVVRGEKWLSLTQGSEFIRLTGLVRTADIQQDNTINSQKIADARITYSGSGQFAQAHKVGWASKFFNSEFWPF